MASRKKAAEGSPAPKKTAKGRPGGKEPKGSETRISKKDVESVAGKLEAFVKDLPQQEQDVLGWILTRAQAAPQAEMAAAAATVAPDVPGLKTPLATQLARSVGFGAGRAAQVDVTVVVGWQYRFGRVDPGGKLVNPVTPTKR